MENTDKIFLNKNSKIGDFVFDERVADVFSDMINRSVPGYASIVTMIGILAEEYSQSGTLIYDLGCSLGAATLSMRSRVDKEGCKIIAVDNSNAMVQRCVSNIDRDHNLLPVDVVCSDLQSISIDNASVIVLNFVLQFIDPEERDSLIKKIFNGLNSGGILILSEKIKFDDFNEQTFQDTLHSTFKRLNGYSDLEISRKRSSLENVLKSDLLESQKKRLFSAGFSKVYVWFQCFNFVSMVAVK